MSNSFNASYSFTSSSTSSSTNGTTTSSSTRTGAAYNTPQGSGYLTSSSENGAPAQVNERHWGADGRQIEGGSAEQDQSRRIQDRQIEDVTHEKQPEDKGVTDAEAGKLYEERIEDEYAKREGGA